MSYVFQEFPKALYREGVYMAVQNAEEEAAMRAQGWKDYLADKEVEKPAPSIDVQGESSAAEAAAPEPKQEPVEAPKRKPGRPAKVK